MERICSTEITVRHFALGFALKLDVRLHMELTRQDTEWTERLVRP